VLVIPRRVTQRFSDLTPEEVSDLFGSVQEIGKVVEKVYGASSLTIAIQVSSFPCYLPCITDACV
jgi:bis(5'-adenosyl)-triphosphatase